MIGKSGAASHFQTAPLSSVVNKRSSTDSAMPEMDEEATPAFGYMRGLRDRALVLEFRYRDGNSDFFPYSWLGPWRFNPSVGILLKFTGDVVTLVLIRGSNLDALVNQSINLTDRGIARQRISWIKEMDEDSLRQAGKGQPTIDRIEAAEFLGYEDSQVWLKKVAPMLVRGSL